MKVVERYRLLVNVVETREGSAVGECGREESAVGECGREGSTVGEGG